MHAVLVVVIEPSQRKCVIYFRSRFCLVPLMPQPYDRETCLEIPLKRLPPLVSEQKWTLTFALIARGTLSADVGQFELVVQGLNAQFQYLWSLNTGLSSASKRLSLDPDWRIWRFFFCYVFDVWNSCKRLLITISEKLQCKHTMTHWAIECFFKPVERQAKMSLQEHNLIQIQDEAVLSAAGEGDCRSLQLLTPCPTASSEARAHWAETGEGKYSRRGLMDGIWNCPGDGSPV